MIVVDVGAARHGEDHSIERLVERYSPALLYALDPLLEREGVWEVGETIVIGVQVAAWTDAGEVEFVEEGLRSRVSAPGSHQVASSRVPALDLAKFLEGLGSVRESASGSIRPRGEVVLKLDCEGAEYPLLSDLIVRGVDLALAGVLVEWHPWAVERAEERRRVIEAEIRCPLEEWEW